MRGVIWFLGGLMAGGMAGYFIAACCAVASRADDEAERLRERGP